MKIDSREGNRSQSILKCFCPSGLPHPGRQVEEDGGEERLWNEEPRYAWFAYHLQTCCVGLSRLGTALSVVQTVSGGLGHLGIQLQSW